MASLFESNEWNSSEPIHVSLLHHRKKRFQLNKTIYHKLTETGGVSLCSSCKKKHAQINCSMNKNEISKIPVFIMIMCDEQDRKFVGFSHVININTRQHISSTSHTHIGVRVANNLFADGCCWLNSNNMGAMRTLHVN